MLIKKLTFQVEIGINADAFEDEWDSDPGRVVWWALEHGDAGGEFGSFLTSEITVEDFEETE